MTRWQRGEADIERMLTEGELQALTGAAADGKQWLAKARRTLGTAAGAADTDPDSAFTLAYDAARFACTALLAQQGLRATTRGGCPAETGRCADRDRSSSRTHRRSREAPAASRHLQLEHHELLRSWLISRPVVARRLASRSTDSTAGAAHLVGA